MNTNYNLSLTATATTATGATFDFTFDPYNDCADMESLLDYANYNFSPTRL